MRHEKQIDFEGYKLTIKELRIGDVRRFLTEIKSKGLLLDEGFNNATVLDLLTNQWDSVEPLLGECFVFSEPDMSIDDVSLSESMKVVEGFMEVNPTFLFFAAQMRQKEPQPDDEKPGSIT